MERQTVQQLIEHFITDTLPAKGDEEHIVVLIETAQSQDEAYRMDWVDGLTRDIPHQFKYAVAQSHVIKRMATGIETYQDFSGKDFFTSFQGRRPVDMMTDEVQAQSWGVNQIRCGQMGRQFDQLVEQMDTFTGRLPFSDLTVHAMFVLHWTKGDVSNVSIRGKIVYDYLTDCLYGRRVWR